MTAILKKELRTYFTTLTGYIFLTFFVFISGFYYSFFNILNAYPNYNETLTFSISMFLILIPIITMRLFAEESKQKTDQLLMTSPVSIPKIVLGKFFAAVLLFLTGVLITCIFPIILSFLGEIPVKQIFGSIFGYILIGMSLISIGIFISSLTDNQIIAAIGTFASIFLCFMMENISFNAPTDTTTSIIFMLCIFAVISFILYNNTKNIIISIVSIILGIIIITAIYIKNKFLFDGIISKSLNIFAILSRCNNFFIGILDISDIIYLITFTTVFLLLTINSIEKKRWS